MFPKFPAKTNQHMPFICMINNNIEYLCCFKKFNDVCWKIYRFNGTSWVRFTNSNDDINECNPFCYQKNNGNVVYSWSFQSKNDVGGSIIFETNYKFDHNKIVFDYNSSKFSFNKSLYGIDYFGNFISRISIKEKYNFELVLSLSDYNGRLLITYIDSGVKKCCYVDNDNLITIKNKRTNKYLYKPCFFNNEWFEVITIDGNVNENRFVIPVKEIEFGC